MSSQSVQSVVADPFRFAAEGRSIRGEVAVSSLSRLSDMLDKQDGTISYSLTGMLDPNQRARLVLSVAGRLFLRCQRCLSGTQWDADIRTVLQPYRVGQPIPDEELEDDGVDAFESNGELDIIALVEDEILLSMPIAPRHETCEPPTAGGGNDEESPFAVLSKLRDGKIRH